MQADVGSVPGGRKLHYLQALRAIAALLVVADHASAQIMGTAGTPAWFKQFGWFLGEQGVAIFFVISGFIMAYTTKNDFGSPRSAARFLLRRMIRVIPLYWIFTVLAASLIASGLWLSGRSVHIADLLPSLFFIPYGDGPMRPLLGQGWTLNYEMAFYAVFAFCMLFPRRLGTALAAALLLFAVACGNALNPVMEGLDPATGLSFFLAPYLVLFVVGIVAGEFAARGHALRVEHTLLKILALLAISITIYVVWKPPFQELPWRMLFWSFCSLAVLISVSPGQQAHGCESVRLFEHLGDSSYSLYLSHVFVLYGLSKAWRILIGDPGFLFIPVAFIVCSACAVPIFRFVERPMYLSLQRFFKVGASSDRAKRKAAVAAAGA
ncbi:acyltransferase [Rhizobium sp. BK251]|uniref:acyltransferase family protein n=1 Tax=Rhizobium sp. BK251 TaxID=2512125 RepID=UPI0010476142|nr:acyltransferase [Rhizobium sp. BK251]TCL76210.1 peptidoglycan/LPS O-acetylase OafA/YrhL [Rhizobium sp. BK251]